MRRWISYTEYGVAVALILFLVGFYDFLKLYIQPERPMKINYVLTVSSGHVALVLFVLVILIGIRARFAGNGRIGQDNAWIVHTVLGWAAILLVFLHVFFAAKIFPKYLPRLKDLLLCKVEKYKNPMIFTYIVVALAFLATLRRTPHKMKLQHDSKWWKRALGYIAGTVPWAVWFVPHILLWAYLPLVYKHVAPEKGIHPLRPLSVAMLLLVGGMFILRVIFRFFWPISRVTKVTPLSDNGELMLLDVILPSRGFQKIARFYIARTFPDAGWFFMSHRSDPSSAPHPFTAALIRPGLPHVFPVDQPEILSLQFIIRATPHGTFTTRLPQLVGKRVSIAGPYGEFSLSKKKMTVAIGGGSGIAPIFALLQSLAGKKTTAPLRAILCIREPDAAKWVYENVREYMRRVNDVSRENETLLAGETAYHRAVICCTNVRAVELANCPPSNDERALEAVSAGCSFIAGRPTDALWAALLSDTSSHWSVAQGFVCGPSGLAKQVKTALCAARIRCAGVYEERFDM